MRITPSSLVVDCGAAHVARARFACGRSGRLELQSFAVEVHAAEPGDDARWLASTAEALRELTVVRPGRGACRVALPGHLVLAKLTAAPAAAAAQSRAAQALAVAQAMPHPVEELCWDAQQMAGNGAGNDLLVAAGKAQRLGEFGAVLVAAGLEPTGFEPAALALARAYRYNYADDPAATLVLDLGARSTTLLLAAADGRVRFRTLPLGGNAVTQALAEAWGIDFTAAEATKRRWLDRDDGQPHDPALAAAMADAADCWMQRLQFETQRTLAALARDEGWPAPTRVLLTGGASAWPGLAERLAMGLELPVGPYDALRRVVVSATAERPALAAHGRHLAVLVGLAAPLPLGSRRLDVRPAPLQARERFRRRQPWLLAAGIAIAVALGGGAWRVRTEDAAIRRQCAEIGAKLDGLRREKAADAATAAERARLRGENDRLRHWRDDRSCWAAWLGAWQDCLAAHGDVWLERFRLRDAAEGVAAGESQVEVGGWLLDLQQPLAPPGPEALARLQALLGDIAALPYVARVMNERHDRSRPGLLGFGCTIVLKPDHPL